jgi:hypothetical protein
MGETLCFSFLSQQEGEEEDALLLAFLVDLAVAELILPMLVEAECRDRDMLEVQVLVVLEVEEEVQAREVAQTLIVLVEMD